MVKKAKKFHKGASRQRDESKWDSKSGVETAPELKIEPVNSDATSKTKVASKPFSLHLRSIITQKVVKSSVRVALGAFSLALVVLIVNALSVKPGNTVLGSSSKALNTKAVKESTLSAVPLPNISAVSAISVSTKQNKILFAKNPDLKLPPASTTKILTALVSIKDFNLDEVISVPEECTKVESSKMGLFAGEKMNVETLLYGLLVPSAGDAACTLASNHFSSGAFLVKMNELAKKIGLAETNFTNVVGLDSDDGTHVSSARDLYLMSKEAMKNGTFRKIVGTKETTLYSVDGKYSHHIVSTNKLLFELPGTLGIKTGTTPMAKEVLVYSYQHKDDEILIVVMGSSDRFGDTKAILNYSILTY